MMWEFCSKNTQRLFGILGRKKKRKLVLLIDDEEKWLKDISQSIAGLSTDCEVGWALFCARVFIHGAASRR